MRESYAQDLLDDARRGRDPRARLPDRRRLRLLGRVARAAARARPARRRGGLRARVLAERDRGRRASLRESIGQTKRLVAAVGADLGVVFDRAAERLYLIDEQAHEIPVEQALLLFLRLIGSNGRRGQARVPGHRHEPGRPSSSKGSGLEVVRTPASLAELTKAAAEDGVIFAGAVGGGYVFPEFLPAYDAMASLCKLLELLAPVERPLSELVAELPESTLVHRQLPCPWA